MKRLFEMTRQEILAKSKNEDPAKFARRLNYVNSIKPMSIAKDLFIKTGTLTVPISVGDYTVTVHVSGIMKLIRKELDRANRILPDRPIVYSALRQAVDQCELQVDCTCPDFRYRHAYWGSKNNYKYGKPERRPANITNPDNKGAVCKHTTAALVRPSQWLKYVSGWISTVVRAYLENKLGIDADDAWQLVDPEDADDVKDEIESIQDLGTDKEEFEDSDVEIPSEPLEDEDTEEPEAKEEETTKEAPEEEK